MDHFPLEPLNRSKACMLKAWAMERLSFKAKPRRKLKRLCIIGVRRKGAKLPVILNFQLGDGNKKLQMTVFIVARVTQQEGAYTTRSKLNSF